MKGRIRSALGALRDFLRGFIGLAGSGGPAPDGPPPGTRAEAAAEVRDALSERADRRKSCC